LPTSTKLTEPGEIFVWEIRRQHERFLNTARSVLMPNAFYEQQAALGLQIKALPHMDGAEHTSYRLVANDRFKPADLRRTVEASIHTIAREFVDRMMEGGRTCDFARDVGLLLPLRVIMNAFGVPEEDEPLMLEVTQKIFGSEDPEFGTGVHFCLGADLTRMEIGIFFRELIGGLEHLDLDGEPVQLVSNFVGGLKNLSVRYRLNAGVREDAATRGAA